MNLSIIEISDKDYINRNEAEEDGDIEEKEGDDVWSNDESESLEKSEKYSFNCPQGKNTF